MRYLIASLVTLMIFTGCTRTIKEYVYVDSKCPSIEALPKVPNIHVVPVDGCVCNNELLDLIKGAHQLRNSEEYYIKEVTKYNSKFTDK